MKRFVFPCYIAAFTLLLFAPTSTKIFAQEVTAQNYAQHLIDVTLAKYAEVVTLAMHVTPPKSDDNVIIASNFGRIGKKAVEDDMKVIHTGEPILEVHISGKRFEVEMQLHDRSGKTIGAVSEVFAYKAGDDKQEFQKRAEVIRAEVEKKIPSVEKLFEPTP